MFYSTSIMKFIMLYVLKIKYGPWLPKWGLGKEQQDQNNLILKIQPMGTELLIVPLILISTSHTSQNWGLELESKPKSWGCYPCVQFHSSLCLLKVYSEYVYSAYASNVLWIFFSFSGKRKVSSLSVNKNFWPLIIASHSICCSFLQALLS